MDIVGSESPRLWRGPRAHFKTMRHADLLLACFSCGFLLDMVLDMVLGMVLGMVRRLPYRSLMSLW